MSGIRVGRFEMTKALAFLALALCNAQQPCFAGEDLITTAKYKDGEPIPYILNYDNLSPKYVVILFPGGNGIVNPHMQDGRLVYGFADNFLVRS